MYKDKKKLSGIATPQYYTTRTGGGGGGGGGRERAIIMYLQNQLPEEEARHVIGGRW